MTYSVTLSTLKIRATSSYDDMVSVLMLEDDLSTNPAKQKVVPLRRRPELAMIYRANGQTGNHNDRGAEVRRMDPARAVMRWYLQGKCDLEELLLHLYFGHLSVSSVDAIVAQLWGKSAGAVLLSDIVPGLLDRLDLWLQRPIAKKFPCLIIQEVVTRPRLALGESASRLAMVAGIDENGYCNILGIKAAPIESERFWEILFTELIGRGLARPDLAIGDPKGAMAATVTSYWRRSRFLPFYSDFHEQLTHGVSSSDRELMAGLIANFDDSSNLTEAKLYGFEILQRLRRTGYAALSAELDDKLHHHLGYFEIPPMHRYELRKVDKIRIGLGQVRERARVIGPIFDNQVLVRLSAAGFRRLSRTTLLPMPLIQYGGPVGTVD